MRAAASLPGLWTVACLLLSGCSTAPPSTIRIPVPVECRVQTPARPAMPTESLGEGVELDRFIASAQAEIEIREGYEGELRAALDHCMEPIAAM